MEILIVYASGEGQTRKIARYIASQIGKDGHSTVVHDSALPLGDLKLDTFGAIFVAASVHNHAHQDTIVGFVTAHRSKLETTPSAFLSVSLSAAMKNGKYDAQNYGDAFFEKTGWHPTDILLVAGALRYSEYDYFRQQIVKTIMYEKGNLFDAEHDHEFTDWQEITNFAQSFLTKASLQSSVHN